MFLHKDAGEMGVAGVRTIVEDSIPDLHINLVVLLQIQQAGHWQANPAGVIAFAVGSGDGLASSVEHGRSAVNVALVDDASKWEEERAADGRCEHAIGRVHRTTCYRLNRFKFHLSLFNYFFFIFKIFNWLNDHVILISF